MQLNSKLFIVFIGMTILTVISFMLALSQSTVRIIPILILTPTTQRAPFEPAYYNLPDEIAGYKILIVKTPQNMACMASDSIGLVLQAPLPNLQSNSNLNVMTELDKLSLKPKHWDLTYVGPGTSKQQILGMLRDWDPRNFTCINIGGPFRFSTPTLAG